MTTHRWMQHILALLLMMPTLSQARGSTAGSDEKLLHELERAANLFMVEWQQADAADLAKFFLDDFLFAGPRGVRSKAETLAALARCNLAAFTLRDFALRRSSLDSAVLVYKVHHDMTCVGHKVVDDTVNTDVFVRQGGQWRIALTTETPLLAP